MSKLITFLLLLPALASAAVRSVSVNENAVILAPTSLFDANSNLVESLVRRHQFSNVFAASLTAKDVFTNRGYILMTNVTAGQSVPPSGYVKVFASNNTVFALSSSGTLTDLASGGAGGATAINDLGDASGNGTVAFGNTAQLWTSSMDAADGRMLRLRNTTATLADGVTLLTLDLDDGPLNPAGVYFELRNDVDGAPTVHGKFSQTLFEIAVPFKPLSGASVTTTALQLAADNNAWAASRGALQFHDGTANTFLLGALASDTPSNGQVPKWNTGGTITWESDNEGAGGADSDAIHDNVGGEIAAVTAKATPVGADFLLIEDSAASNAKKSITISALETALSGFLDLQSLQGAVTDAQVPNTITVDLATVATTANAGDSATSFFSSGTLEDARLPTTMDGKTLTSATATMSGTLAVNDVLQRFPAKVLNTLVIDVTSTNNWNHNTSTNFTSSFTGTAVPGQQLRFGVSNYNASTIFWTNAGIFRPSVASNVTIFAIPGNSKSVFDMEWNTNDVAAGRWEIVSEEGLLSELGPSHFVGLNTNGNVISPILLNTNGSGHVALTNGPTINDAKLIGAPGASSLVVTNFTEYVSAINASASQATNHTVNFNEEVRHQNLTNAVWYSAVSNVPATNRFRPIVHVFRNVSGSTWRIGANNSATGFRMAGTNDVAVPSGQQARVYFDNDCTGLGGLTNITVNIVRFDNP